MLERASRSHMLIGLVSVTFLLGAFLAFVRTTQAVEPGTSQFQRTWDRTDKPVNDGQIARTWMWGPEAFTNVMDEPYVESPNGTRQVQYFDKARMEINFPDAPDDGLWYVTNGLLVVEMITGQMQVGENNFETRGTSLVNVAGDPNDPASPTYSSFISHLDQSPDRTGQTLTQRIARDGTVSDDAGLASQGVTAGYYDEVTGHNVANVFWDFMNSQGLVYEDGQFFQDQLFVNPFYATGRPITEPYFADVQVAGAVQTVLMQCFERRCMTFTPTNNAGFQVEAGNVGLHYFCWRYGYLPEGKGECIGSPVTPVPTVPGDNGGGDGNATSTPGGGDNGGPTATPGDTDPTATPPSGDAPGVDVDLNLGTVQISALGGGYNVPVYVANTGTQTDTIEVTLTKDAAISLCGPNSQSESITLNGGQNTILNFSQSCGILSVDLAVQYTATATIARSPGASDTDTDSLLLVLDIGGGDQPTATAPSGNAPGVDVALNLGSVEISALGGSYNVPVRVTNTGSQTDTIQVSLSRNAVLSTCTLSESSKSVTLAGGASETVTFQESCGVLAAQVLVTYTATGTITRSPGATDTAQDQLIVKLAILPGDGGGDDPPPTGNNPGVDVNLNLSAISVNASLLSGTDPFTVPVQVKNTGTQTDSIRVVLTGSAVLGTCSPSPASQTVTVAGGASTTVNFTQSCSGILNLVGVQLLVNYSATGTIDRAPGASDTATATQILNLNLLGGSGDQGGGDNPPPGNSANVVITSVPNNQTISVSVGGTLNVPITIKNNGDSAASGQVSLAQTAGISTCSPTGSTSYSNLAPGSSKTVTFSKGCLITLGALVNYTVQVSVDGTTTDTETFSVTLSVTLLGNGPTSGFMLEAA